MRICFKYYYIFDDHFILLERETKQKEENEKMIKQIQELLAKESKSDAEKEALKNYFLSKQSEVNDRLIMKQTDMIQSLQARCQTYEDEFKKIGNLDGTFLFLDSNFL